MKAVEKSFDIRKQGGERFIFDVVRRRYVRLTPEEWVRQNLVRYLIEGKGYRKALLAVEQEIEIDGRTLRADVIAHDSNGKPLLVVECKAPEVKLRQDMVEQVSRYNVSLQADVLAVTNGNKTLCWSVDLQHHSYSFLPEIPDFNNLRQKPE